MTPLAITGIHTGIGKTVSAAALTQALQCDYWKPIQAGELDNSDSMIVQRLLSQSNSRVFPEAFRLKTAASPHIAAQIEGIHIDIASLKAPNSTETPLLIETAGGVMSPVTANDTVADLLAHHGWPTVLVVQHYLGSINHTLSAIESLKARQVTVIGLIINGNALESSETFIAAYSGLPILARVPLFTSLDAKSIAKVSQQISAELNPALRPWQRRSER
ncbi:ATP-dependent dethiobiotin synthetase BioD [Formosimonas limnophila]|uniref:ATP-dependent dethiobiotin synthetase BioD n=1 Tax=Formosimonas limnophila TaxID=1384487 RepID=A0A8J3CMD4_9BURK|nr:dethiobiotin synthase [Formosimonas limnophila]GHA68046.1 ATP-dependent dethiobiotin synthetase BioD [Formosimonas limnophila]